MAADGGVFTFGDARFYGSTGGITLNKPIVGMASTPDGGGSWLVAADGGVFTFGDASYHGSTGDVALQAPIRQLVPTADGGGYRLLAADGGVFTFGDGRFYGSADSSATTKLQFQGDQAIGLLPTPDSGGYWLVADDGQEAAFGDAAVPEADYSLLAKGLDGTGSVALSSASHNPKWSVEGRLQAGRPALARRILPLSFCLGCR